MNSAISSAVDGDIVDIGSGTCSMSRLNNIVDKNITVKGQGKTATVITANGGFGQIISNGSKAPQWKLKGLKLTSTSATNNQPIVVWADGHASWRGPFWIDDIDIDFPNNCSGSLFTGPMHGVISNSRFSGTCESAINMGMELTSSLEPGGNINSMRGAYVASLDYLPGTANSGNYLYIEDCIFVSSGSGGIAAIDTNYTGGRVVFRYNTLTRAALYAHWTSTSSWNSLWWEVYGNTFDWNGGTGGVPAMRLQGGGTGLIYNNTVIGFTGANVIQLGEQRLIDRSDAPLNLCGSANAHDGSTDSAAPGWPCVSQTGRAAGKTMAQITSGTKQASFPLYIWNNGPQAKCSNSSAGGAACDNSFTAAADEQYFKSTAHSTSGFGNGDVDWCKTSSQPSGCGTHTLTYTAYTYPHPLRGGATPQIPNNFRFTLFQ